MIECWKPCVGSSLAAAACFSLFMLSPFQPMRQFGLLITLATCFAMLANQIVLPPLLATQHKAGRTLDHNDPTRLTSFRPRFRVQ
jgi:predicted RND superfamily exporter protein